MGRIDKSERERRKGGGASGRGQFSRITSCILVYKHGKIFAFTHKNMVVLIVVYTKHVTVPSKDDERAVSGGGARDGERGGGVGETRVGRKRERRRCRACRHISFIDSNKGNILLRGQVSLVAFEYTRIYTHRHMHTVSNTHT